MTAPDLDKLRRTIAARDRRIARLVSALKDAEAKGYVTQAEQEPAIVRSDATPAAMTPEVRALMLAGSKLAVAAWQGERVSEAIDEWDAALRGIGGEG